MMNLGGRIKQRRKELQWSQAELAQVSGVGQGTISKIERTDQDTSTFIVELATALGVSAPWLKTGEGPQTGEHIAGPKTDDISEEEQTYLKLFRAASPERQAIVADLLGHKTPDQK